MFEIKDCGDGRVALVGRFDAAQTSVARDFLNAMENPSLIDFSDLDYISSAGLGVLLGTQKRLTDSGKGLKLINMSKHIREIFRITGFDRIFEIE